MNLAVDREFVAEETIEIELIEEQQPVAVEVLVRKNHGNVEFAARQPKRVRVAVGFVARIALVEQQIESGEPLVDIGRGEFMRWS